MRTEKEMFDLILGVAQSDERIRAVYMNGSRTNPNVPKDQFQDYDIVYVVTEIASFLQDPDWIQVFGDRLMLQEPDKMDRNCGIEMNFDRSYMILMLFTDGNRIDLRLLVKEAMLEEYRKEKLTVLLLDKDNGMPQIPPPTDADYHVKRPTEPLYISCCNDFWWCLQNVAKGMGRDELPYVKQMFESVIRDQLDTMVAWWIGIQHDFKVSVGKMGKYYKNYLPESYYDMYKQTYSDSNYEHIWKSVFVTCDLFRALAQDVAKHSEFTYAVQDDTNMMEYLKRVHESTPNTSK
ncbi:aminoglycoside 6-adenylyltransferase [Paenibacillus sp. KN14-4R]|uniref:aminoglycoside 6-adenylyltransferase n=1 Tax=Paenibacillus sp. KN14-4R TaxID=3445773 RepID=UPI003FA04064